MLPVLTGVLGALVGAGGALLAAWLMENYKRHLDRRSLAAALLSEATLLTEALGPEAEVYKRLREVIRNERPVPSFIGTALMFRVSVYEKCANQIGQLGPEEAAGLVRFHGFIDGLRDEGRVLFGDDIPAEVRVKTLNWLLDEHLPTGIARAKALQRQLQTVVARKWRPWRR